MDKSSSWIIRDKRTNTVICETFNPKVVEHLNVEKYEAIPIIEYLGSINGNQPNYWKSL